MKTRITVETLIGEQQPTYFLDFECERGCWKNHASSKDLTEMETARKELIHAQISASS